MVCRKREKEKNKKKEKTSLNCKKVEILLKLF